MFGAFFAPSCEVRINPVNLGPDVARENIQHRRRIDGAKDQGRADRAGGVSEEIFIDCFTNYTAGPAGEVVAKFEEIHHRPQAAEGGDSDDHGHDARTGEVAAGLDREIDDPAEKYWNQPRAGTEAKQQNINAFRADPAHRILGPRGGADVATLEGIVGHEGNRDKHPDQKEAQGDRPIRLVARGFG